MRRLDEILQDLSKRGWDVTLWQPDESVIPLGLNATRQLRDWRVAIHWTFVESKPSSCELRVKRTFELHAFRRLSVGRVIVLVRTLALDLYLEPEPYLEALAFPGAFRTLVSAELVTRSPFKMFKRWLLHAYSDEAAKFLAFEQIPQEIARSLSTDSFWTLARVKRLARLLVQHPYALDRLLSVLSPSTTARELVQELLKENLDTLTIEKLRRIV